MSQPLTASNAMVMAFNAPDTSVPFCCAHCPTDCSQPPTVMSTPVKVFNSPAKLCAAELAVRALSLKPKACETAAANPETSEPNPEMTPVRLSRNGCNAPVSMNVLTNVFAHPAAFDNACATEATTPASAPAVVENIAGFAAIVESAYE